RFTRQASMPALPVPDTANVSSFSVRKTARSRRLSSSIRARNAGSRWPMSGCPRASRTRGGTSLGPGPRSKRGGGVTLEAVVVDAAPRTLPIRLGVVAMSVHVSLIDELGSIVGDDGLVRGSEELSVYECDGYPLERSRPEVVALPRSTAEVAAV